jgi:hypothetical protein
MGREECVDDSSETVLMKLPWRPEVKERRGISVLETSEPLGEWSRMLFESVPERSGDALILALLFAIILSSSELVSYNGASVRDECANHVLFQLKRKVEV